MTKVSEIMTRDPVTVDVDATLRQAVEALQSAGVSGAPVLSRGRLVGVISATDILELEATSPGVPPERIEILDWGEPDLPVEGEDGEEFPAAFFVDRWADSEADVWNRISQTESPEWDRLEERTVGEVMTRKVVTVQPDASVAEAARRMLDRKLHRLLVVDGDTLVGIVSAFDILREVADGAQAT
jgi:CBS domain-containing protein